jgi:hypothetical protein
MFNILNFFKYNSYKKIKVEECYEMDIYELQKAIQKGERKLNKMKNKKIIKYKYLRFENY